MLIYLCGPIGGCTDTECKDWRETAKKALPDFQFSDPMDRDFRGIEGDHVKEIVEGDKDDIKQSQLVLVNFPKASVGTAMEILFAWEHRIPVLVVAGPEAPMSPWLKYHAAAIFKSFDEAFASIKAAYAHAKT
jgi:hypothetical protein